MDLSIQTRIITVGALVDRHKSGAGTFLESRSSIQVYSVRRKMLWKSKQDVSKNDYFWKSPFGQVSYTMTRPNFRSDEQEVILNWTWDIVKARISPHGNMVFCVCVCGFFFLNLWLIELKKIK